MSPISYQLFLHGFRVGDLVELYRKPTPEEGAQFQFRWHTQGTVEERWNRLKGWRFRVQRVASYRYPQSENHDVLCESISGRWALPFTCIRRVTP